MEAVGQWLAIGEERGTSMVVPLVITGCSLVMVVCLARRGWARGIAGGLLVIDVLFLLVVLRLIG